MRRTRETGGHLICRGLGRSYGDPAQCAGGTVLKLGGALADVGRVAVNSESNTAWVPGGVSWDALMRAAVSQGYFVPVTPGTRQVTLGGAVAADIHGKNHHVDGSLGDHVRRLEVVDGLGAVREWSPTSDADAFWATVGGMGLTSVVTAAEMDLLPIDTAYLRVTTRRCPSLDAVMSQMSDDDSQFRYTVAWIDTAGRGSRLGRGVITSGDHAHIDELPATLRPVATAFDPEPLATAPRAFPSGALNRVTISAFNTAWYLKAPRHAEAFASIGSFFHPLDGVDDWNRLYGPRGFLQYQFSVPDSAAHLIGRTLQRLRNIGAVSFLSVLKRFGPSNPGPLSFPQPGWTLALDLPAGAGNLGPELDAIDEELVAAGGRIYLAKDSRMSPATFRAMYPQLEQWRATRARLDPDRVFESDQSRRLDL